MYMISVIVPVYNSQNYIERCIESIINQIYQDYELIIIDDGSTDNSYNICKKYLTKKNVRLFHFSNGGLSFARNRGIEKASGEYITFIDSDDEIPNNYLQELFDTIQNDNSDVVSCSLTYIPGPIIEHEKCIMKSNDYIRDVFYKKGLGDYSVAKLYKTNLFNEIKFKEGIIGEDFEIFYRLFKNTNFVSITNRTTYYYHQNIGSISINKFNYHIFDRINTCNYLLKEVTDEKLLKSLKARIVDECLYIYCLMPNDIKYKKEAMWIKNNICKYGTEVFRDSRTSYKIKRKLIIYNTFPFLLRLREPIKQKYIHIYKIYKGM